MTDSQAGVSLARHLVRGTVGFGSLIAAVALIPLVGPVSLVLVIVGALALRGCPACWVMALVEIISMGRMRRSCSNGVCELVRPGERHAEHPVTR
ncbi:hypothetical protein DMB42_06420 [Nonomuraea sp. WAC 01424]|uniref:hypothetical protein n=1 Tax=Nonomuraea sp. WAC 01424 TaxID=2203200 RepID=UPI000F7AB311|nr:hypothetical protein [Nonomuraea sp. WAC 01424]RSN14177.1 hypothetical protein DMB42_06420 [Nonomuraea sp. WAC 01424]